ncbi:hypothetical protein COHA_010187 [Chlorella ohadii]|uniref:Uncharacterized protein n=1 Tax=Chlorella ohadii TaxID=2649997 RepID=A0AAD5GX77_9CHLO|nr:hypothetical protein COHA_010187 [Chlorella ohadii]
MPLSPEDKLILIGGCSVLGAGVAVFCGLRAVADSTRAVANSTQAAAETLANNPGSLGLARLAGAAEATSLPWPRRARRWAQWAAQAPR